MTRSRVNTLGAGFLLLSGLIAAVQGQVQNPSAIDLGQASLEALMDIKVTSVSKREQRLSQTAAAVFVINQEDIRRSGATNIPDILRMAPGVDVEQINGNAWAISIRGFNSRYSNKVLVLIDGRTVYNPIFSGVFWDQLEMPLEDIERIEIIRGPGATVWGANAVNGVISIITKSSDDTKGGLVTAGGGSHTRAVGEVQYGGQVGSKGTYRAFGSYFNIGNSAAQGGGAANDRWQRMNSGFRSDWKLSTHDKLMVQGNLFANNENQSITSALTPQADLERLQTVDAAGGDLLGLWTHTLPGGSQTSVQFYYDTYRRTDLGVPAKVTTFDLDFEHHVSVGEREDIVWGLDARTDTAGVSPGYSVAFKPAFRKVSLFSGFLQDQIQLSDALWFTVGAKLEHNDYTGYELEPSVRLVWAPSAGRQTFWASASKAIRQPARTDTDVRTDVAIVPLSATSVEVERLMGNPKIRAEQLRDYELGYRREFTRTLSLDASSFLSFYHHLGTLEPKEPIIIPGAPLIIEIPLLFENNGHAMDYGGEISLNWQASSRWRISPGYSYLHTLVRLDASSTGITSAQVSKDFPGHMFQIRSLVNLTRTTELDQSVYYTARLPGGAIPGHVRLDLRVAKHIGESTEISLVGQNLLHARTLEYGTSSGVIGTEAVRAIYGKITWRF